MISYQNACSILRELAHVRKLGAENVLLENSQDRILAEDIYCEENIPSFDNSAMDGFALCSEWTQFASLENPVKLSVSSIVYAGDDAKEANIKNEAVEIMTGAPLPNYLDTVIKIESVEVERDSQGRARSIKIFAPIKKGDQIRRAGEDFKVGQEVLKSGDKIYAEHILSLAALGVSKIKVIKKPRVAILNTGKELLHHAETLAPGKIRNSTGPYLIAALSAFGAECEYFGVIADEPKEFEAKVEEILKRDFDLILSTGAVSMGQKDFIKDSLEKIGAKILFHKVSIRPGKPILCADFSHTLFLGLPGNPVSTTVGLRFFASIYLRELQGLKPEIPIRAVLESGCKKPEGFKCFFKGRLKQKNQQLVAEILPGQASFMVRPLLQTNSWVVLPEEGSLAATGSLVEIFPMSPGEWRIDD